MIRKKWRSLGDVLSLYDLILDLILILRFKSTILFFLFFINKSHQKGERKISIKNKIYTVRIFSLASNGKLPNFCIRHLLHLMFYSIRDIYPMGRSSPTSPSSLFYLLISAVFSYNRSPPRDGQEFECPTSE